MDNFIRIAEFQGQQGSSRAGGRVLGSRRREGERRRSGEGVGGGWCEVERA
jgi:hypothetical protein